MATHSHGYSRCPRCQERWPSNGPFCRRCSVELGELRTTRAIETARLARQQALFANLPRADISPRPSVFKTIGGIDYEVTWDGS